MSHCRSMCGLTAAAFVCMCPLAGCGGDSFEIKVAKPANQRPDLSDDVSARGPIRMPSGTPYNLVNPSSRENGSCNARCSADPTGKASAKVEAENGGSGWAEFQVGYTFDYAGKGSLGAVIELSVDLAQEMGTGKIDPNNTAKVNVVFLVKDTNGTTLHSETLLDNNNENGARHWAARQTTAVDANFEPELGYYIVVAARVEAASTAGQKASAYLELKQCEMTIQWKKNASVAGDEAARPAAATR